MKSKIEKKIEKGQKLNRQEEALKRNADEGNLGDPYETPVRIAEAQLGEYKEYDKLDSDGNQVRDYTGMAIMNPAVEFSEGTYNLIGMNNGDIQVGVNALDGSIDAGNGAVHVDANGIAIITTRGYNSNESISFYNDTINSPLYNLTGGYESNLGSGQAFSILNMPDFSLGNYGRIELVRGSLNGIPGVDSAEIWLAKNNGSITNAIRTFSYDETHGVINNFTVSGVKSFIQSTNGLRINPDTGTTVTQGTLSWNTDRDTLDLTQTGTTLQLGQEVHFYVINQTGSTIPNGTAVMFAGSLGASGILKATPAVADGTYPAIYMMGIATQNIPNGEKGKVTFFGEVHGINTSAYSDGDILYLDPATPGGLTKTQPSAPNLKYAMAAVVNAGNNGTIFVRAIYSQALSELNDVTISTPSTNQVLKYDGTKWVNSSAPTASVALDDLTDVAITSPATNEVLKYNGTSWVNSTAPGGTVALDDLTDVVITSAAEGNILYRDGTQWINRAYTIPNTSFMQASTECWTKNDGSFASTAIGTGTISNTSASANHPGVIKISSVATNNTGGAFGLQQTDNIVLGGIEEWQMIINPSSNNSNVTGLLGFMTDFGASVTPTDGLCLKLTGNGTNLDLAFLSRVGGVGSATNFTTLSNGTWYRIKMTNGGTGAVNVYVYNMSGTQLATYNFTGTVTSAQMGFGIKMYRTTNVATDLISIDRIDLYSTGKYTR